MNPTAFAVITGGGTAGHVLPALAIADSLVAAGHRADEIVYVGARRGIETRLLKDSPYPHHFLDVVGLQRRLALSNIAFPLKLIRATLAARSLLKQLRPSVVVSVGGYASFPATFAARLAHIPIVVVSYDRRPGLATRVSARFANVCAVAFEGSKLPHARMTGAPVRSELIALDRMAARDDARKQLGIPDDRFLVAVFSGSLGSKAINEAVTEMVEIFESRPELAVRHVVGERFLADAAPSHSGENGIMYDVIGYEDHMVQVYAAADLMITRAGASTIAELSTAGVPAIIIPWPGAAEDHQTDNASVLGSIGAAVVLPESELSGLRLATLVNGLFHDPASLQEMAASAYAVGEIHRSGRLANVIELMAEQR
ncbi:MAG: undecaprenyldiphospho-muramoylpentapeptide beta-N-acetylglucosaminyltransferase [Actinomycetota bacterium]